MSNATQEMLMTALPLNESFQKCLFFHRVRKIRALGKIHSRSFHYCYRNAKAHAGFEKYSLMSHSFISSQIHKSYSFKTTLGSQVTSKVEQGVVLRC